MKKIIQKAPCRIDLAGGTVDLWPLYLHLSGLELVHMAIDVQAEARVTWEKSRKGLDLSIESLDLNRKTQYRSLDELRESLAHGTDRNPLRWIGRVVHQRLVDSKFTGKLEIVTRSDAPPGSGLGGSSVLGIALGRALERSIVPAKQKLKPWDLQQTIRDLEAAEIEHPAGDQDYVPALFGGLLVFKLGPHRRSIETLPLKTAKGISERTALLYTGKPHHSGLNNWQIFKAFHEKDARVRRSLEAIRDLSARMAGALRDDGLSSLASTVPDLLNEEWSERLRLSPAVNAPVLDEAWEYARRQGAIARKACGAGGGGCVLVWFKDAAAKKAALAKALPSKDWRWLSTDVVPSFKK